MGSLASCDPYVFAYCACKLIFPVSSVSFVYFVSLVFLVSLLYVSCISLPFSPVILAYLVSQIFLVNPAKIMTRKKSLHRDALAEMMIC